jgi:hypothetical protein
MFNKTRTKFKHKISIKKPILLKALLNNQKWKIGFSN